MEANQGGNGGSYNVEAVDVSFSHPTFHFVGDGCRRSDACCSEAADWERKWSVENEVHKDDEIPTSQRKISPIICLARVLFVHFPPLTSGAVLIRFFMYPWIALLSTYLNSSSSP